MQRCHEREIALGSPGLAELGIRLLLGERDGEHTGQLEKSRRADHSEYSERERERERERSQWGVDGMLRDSKREREDINQH